MLSGGLVLTRKIIKNLPVPDNRWRMMYLLIIFFIIGYIIFTLAIFGEPISFVVWVVSSIFLGGGAFVLTVTYLSSKTISDVRQYTQLENEHYRIVTAQRRLETILDNVAEGIITFDQGGNIQSINRAGEKLFGYSQVEVIGHPISILIPPPNIIDAREGYLHHFMRTEIQRLIGHEGEVTGRHKDGARFPMALKVSEIKLGDDVVYTALAADISERKAMVEHLRVMAEHDGLTGLHNRTFFHSQLEQFVERVKRTNHSCALLYIDLDNFKYVNDTLGHAAGDQLIIEVAAILQKRARKTDVTARFGGDEFTVLLYNVGPEQASKTAESFRKSLANYRFRKAGETVDVGCSIGVALITPQTQNASAVMSQADLACHLAKRAGRNRIHLFTSSDSENVMAMSLDMGWSQRIKNAIDKNRFALACQPIVNTRTREIESYEVLIRMLDEQDELIMPMGFLPTAERFGLSADIDKWVIVNAIETLIQQRRELPKLHYSINLSSQALTDLSICDLIMKKLKSTGLDAAALTFEVTETVAIADMAAAEKFLSRLQAIGCKTSLDDFGSGMASFAYLKDLPVDYVKIDGRFVKNLATNSVDQAMVKAMNEIAHALGKQTIAEFVENEASFVLLKEYGVDYGQGYYLGRPDMTLPCKAIMEHAGGGVACYVERPPGHKKISR
ncbi:MAG: EAL domain-containing protein [Gammaproteobacteria bacterium]|nr:EAL domain-containing protein [Gammaproteobacteria bacterium]